MQPGQGRDLELDSAGVRLCGSERGAGPAVILLHGLTATRRYVVMGSQALARAGHRVIAYDARGHGLSSPAQRSDEYGYEALAADLEAVLDACSVRRAVLAGVSMGAHTCLRLALNRPRRVAALALITPGYDPGEPVEGARTARFDALAASLRERGVEGFLETYSGPAGSAGEIAARWRAPVLAAVRQRMLEHAHPEAVADALSTVPRSRPFGAWEELAALAQIPTVVVASRDQADPEHPLALARRYAQAIPGADVRTEDVGHSPLAWRGGAVSRVIADVAARADD